jgi:hypothetical protein
MRFPLAVTSIVLDVTSLVVPHSHTDPDLEVYPPQKSYSRSSGPDVEGCFLHEYLVAGWGMPVGELFDLE